jgi:acetyl-CoA C-acetyltransferase
LPRAVILSAVRTPYGRLMGSLAGFEAAELGSTAVRTALSRAGVDPSSVGSLYMGNVHSHAQRGNPAAGVVEKTGLSPTTASCTMRAGCISGLSAVIAAVDGIMAGRLDVVVAGGMESNSRAPHLVHGLRKGLRLGGGNMLDAVRHDGPQARPAGGEITPTAYLNAHKNQLFKDEIVPLEIPATRKRPSSTLDHDDAALILDPAGTPGSQELPPLADGAAALVIASEAWAEKKGLTPLASVMACGDKPLDTMEIFREARFVEGDLAGSGLVNEKDLAPEGKHPGLNVRGGATQMGHAAGADGARLVVSLVHMLRGESGGRGLALAYGGWDESAGLVVDFFPNRSK